MLEIKMKQERRNIRHRRVRARIHGTANRPRLSVFRSNRRVWTQLIDDERGATLVSAHEGEVILSGKQKKGEGKIARAEKVGMLVAERASSRNIKAAVFDRGGYRYHGRVKAVADGARKGGLRM